MVDRIFNIEIKHHEGKLEVQAYENLWFGNLIKLKLPIQALQRKLCTGIEK